MCFTHGLFGLIFCQLKWAKNVTGTKEGKRHRRAYKDTVMGTQCEKVIKSKCKSTRGFQIKRCGNFPQRMCLLEKYFI